MALLLSLISLATPALFWQPSLFSPIISPITNHFMPGSTLCTPYLELRSIQTHQNNFMVVLESMWKKRFKLYKIKCYYTRFHTNIVSIKQIIIDIWMRLDSSPCFFHPVLYIETLSFKLSQKQTSKCSCCHVITIINPVPLLSNLKAVNYPVTTITKSISKMRIFNS